MSGRKKANGKPTDRQGRYSARKPVGGVKPELIDVSAPLSMVPIYQIADGSRGGIAR